MSSAVAGCEAEPERFQRLDDGLLAAGEVAGRQELPGRVPMRDTHNGFGVVLSSVLGDAVHRRRCKPVAGQELVGTQIVVLVHGLKYCFAGDVGKRHDRNVAKSNDNLARSADIRRTGTRAGNRSSPACVQTGMDGFDPDDPAVVTAIDLVRWELSLHFGDQHTGNRPLHS